MKIVLEGTSDEVGRMLRALAGPYSFEAFQAQDEGRTMPVAAVAAMVAPNECPVAFESLAREWAENFDVTGKKHWDESASNTGPDPKAEALRQLSISSDNGKVLKWVEAKGGLTHAVHEFVADKKTARSVAANMAQVASILFTDLADLLEHFDPFEDE